MELSKEIKDKDWPKDKSTLKIRQASRAVLFDEKNLIPLLFVSKYNYHKLPGGGIKDNEDKITTLAREVSEEVGCKIKLINNVGKIIEFRSKRNLKQISYCYYGKIISKDQPHFTKKELSQGFRIIWLNLKKAILTLAEDKPNNYEGQFIKKRDLTFLKKVEEILNAK